MICCVAVNEIVEWIVLFFFLFVCADVKSWKRMWSHYQSMLLIMTRAILGLRWLIMHIVADGNTDSRAGQRFS